MVKIVSGTKCANIMRVSVIALVLSSVMCASTMANGQTTNYTCEGASPLVSSANRNFSPIASGNTLTVRGIAANTNIENKEYTIGSEYTEQTEGETGNTLTVTQIGDGEEPISIGSQNKSGDRNISNAEKLTIRAEATIASAALSSWTSLKTLVIESESPEPLPMGNGALPPQFGEAGTKCKIVVPKGQVELYGAAEGWKTYREIISDGEQETHPAGLREDATGSKITVSGHVLSFTETTDATILSLTGKMVAHGRLRAVELGRGIYIVSIDESGKKIKVCIK